MLYKLPSLPYPYNTLEPYFDAQTMEIHHTKHHQTYVDKLNKAIESAQYQAPACVCELISDLSKVPETIRSAVRNNAGGHVNHTFFWKILSRRGCSEPCGALSDTLNATFGSLNAFKTQFKEASIGHFGSGWVWLCAKKEEAKGLFIQSTSNQDNPIMKGVVERPGVPIIGLDLWEHAYYLRYQNRRPDYIDAFWEIVNWKQAEENYKKALEGCCKDQ